MTSIFMRKQTSSKFDSRVATCMCQLAPVSVPTCPGTWGGASALNSTFGDYFHDKSETINCMH